MISKVFIKTLCLFMLVEYSETAESKMLKTVHKIKRAKTEKNYDCTDEIRNAMIGWAESSTRGDWETFRAYYHEDMYYMRFDEPTYFGKAGVVQGTKNILAAFPGVVAHLAIAEAFCTDKKTAVGICIAQLSTTPDHYIRGLLVWRKVKGRWVLIREALAGTLGLLKTNPEFGRWGVPNVNF